MKITFRRTGFALASAGLVTIYGCSGGGSTLSNGVDLPITVIDGAIQNATVCLDKNDSGTCETGEPSGKTNVAGKVTLKIESADAGKYPVIAVVGTDAIDADTGAVPSPFTLRAPADRNGVISPLTTLVQNLIATSRVGTAEAEALIKTRTGISASLFDDFTVAAPPTDGSVSAATVARMLVVATQVQTGVISSTVGTLATDGSTVTSVNLDQIIQKKLSDLLPSLIAAVTDPAVQSATTPGAREAALLAAATTLINTSGLTAAQVPTAVAINNVATTVIIQPATAPEASANLNRLTFNSASDWVLRVSSSTAAQNTAGLDGSTKYRENRSARVGGGAPYSWGPGSSADRGSQVNWNGTAWANCPINFENSSSAANAYGKFGYNYCNGAETGISNPSATFEVANRPMIDVYNEIRAAGYTNVTIDSAASVLGTAAFPAGSVLRYGSGEALTTTISYEPRSDNAVSLAPVAVGAGRTDPNDSTAACANSSQNTPVATLEGMIAVIQGKPCISNPGSVTGSGGVQLSTGTRNEAWGSTTLALGTVGSAPSNLLAANATSFYTTNTRLRVAFGSGNVANYFSCQERFDGSTRNCDLLGSGTYAIQTLGDGRAMTFSGLPAATAVLTSKRVFVERSGRVYYGFNPKAGAFSGAGLNLPALNALFGVLGLPTIDPNTPIVLSAASYSGTYKGTFTGTDSGTFTTAINPAGVTSCSGTSVASGAFICNFTVTPSTTDTTKAAISIGVTSTGAAFNGIADYNTGLISGSWANGTASGTFAGGRF